MPVSQADIDALNTALATGERTVRTGDILVEYRSVGDLIRARDDLVSQKATEDAAAAGQLRPRQVLFSHGGRGY